MILSCLDQLLKFKSFHCGHYSYEQAMIISTNDHSKEHRLRQNVKNDPTITELCRFNALPPSSFTHLAHHQV